MFGVETPVTVSVIFASVEPLQLKLSTLAEKVKGADFSIVKGMILLHPIASVTVRLKVPAGKLEKVSPDAPETEEPGIAAVGQAYEYGVFPSAAVAVALPVLAGGQSSLTVTKLAEIGALSISVSESTRVQLKSFLVIVTV